MGSVAKARLSLNKIYTSKFMSKGKWALYPHNSPAEIYINFLQYLLTRWTKTERALNMKQYAWLVIWGPDILWLSPCHCYSSNHCVISLSKIFTSTGSGQLSLSSLLGNYLKFSTSFSWCYGKGSKDFETDFFYIPIKLSCRNRSIWFHSIWIRCNFVMVQGFEVSHAITPTHQSWRRVLRPDHVHAQTDANVSLYQCSIGARIRSDTVKMNSRQY